MFRKAFSGFTAVVALGCLSLTCQKPEEAPQKPAEQAAKPKLARASRATVMSHGPAAKPVAPATSTAPA